MNTFIGGFGHDCGVCRCSMKFFCELNTINYWDSKYEFLNITEVWVTLLEHYVERIANGEEYIVEIAEDLIENTEKIIECRMLLQRIYKERS